VRFWGKARPSIKFERGFTVLTDGRQDDTGAYWTDNGQIHFVRSITNSRSEAWTMNADGTNQRRANTEIKSLLAGRWSPDGKKVIFTKDDVAHAVFLADANGANEIALPSGLGNLDWSPDGSHVVFQAKGSTGTSEVFLYTLDSGTSVSLTPGVWSADPS